MCRARCALFSRSCSRATRGFAALQCVILTPLNDDDADGFFDSLHFRLFGRLPGRFTLISGQKYDAAVWATPFFGHKLVEYRPPAQGAGAADEEQHALLDLSAPDLPSRIVKPMPTWARDCLFQFLLPLGCVVILFVISYILVRFGPLKGISGGPPSMSPNFASVEHDMEEGEYDDL